ncbi:hypothetical protein MKW98_017178 [Papaver atlanticum]|uniref:CCT domain-containing protein n=1 Tax=Papaver atlanticum TaxID=357466 RepID=A0AAD4SBC9_9MAGN|nr:hypothetical protein MKW98_017178 [Papaver atlanticum]
MYGETGLLYPYFQSFTQDVQQLEEFYGNNYQQYHYQKPSDSNSMGNMLSTTSSFEYDMGGEGDLFKAPEPILQEPLMGLDTLSDTISMISGGNNEISSQTINVVDMETMQNEHLLNEVYYECKKELMEKSAIGEEYVADDLDVKVPLIQMDEDPDVEIDRLISDVLISKAELSECLEDPIEEIDRLMWEGAKQKAACSKLLDDEVEAKDKLNLGGLKHNFAAGSSCLDDPFKERDKVILEDSKQNSVSSDCLSSPDWMRRDFMRLNFADFNGVDFGAAGMRRAFSEGDIQTIYNVKNNILASTYERTLTIGNCTTDERMLKLSRYRIKKAKRNFGRTIKYACRKALADNQPRVRGRFAKTEETDIPKGKPCKTVSRRVMGQGAVEKNQ